MVALGVFGVSAIVAMFGLGNSIKEIGDAEVAKSADALLASAGVNEDKTIALPVTYFDQKADECVDMYDTNARTELKSRQFEWISCDYYTKKLEQGLVESSLDENDLPVAKAGKLVTNRGLDFGKWFDAVEGESAEYVGTLQLKYTADEAKFEFLAPDFYPLDEAEFSASDEVNSDGHNHLFTMNFAVPFTVLKSGEETFEITADDDTFVFLDGKLVLDMGGVHEVTTGAVKIGADGRVFASVDNEDWQRTDVALTAGELATLKIFHADRDSSESELDLAFSQMNLALNEGTQIAANVTGENDPTYVGPLGETRVFAADATRSLMIIATIEGVVVIVAAVLLVSVARFVVKQKIEK